MLVFMQISKKMTWGFNSENEKQKREILTCGHR